LFSRALDLAPPHPPATRPKPEAAPAAKPAAERGPVRVGGDVRPPQLLRQFRPAYPALARAARVQGTVQIQALLARDGSVQSAKVAQGHPLLASAALDAVRQWRYAPTLLNGEAVEVILLVDVNFTLSQ
jgi:protein TonB